ncbi:hypothetical protein GH714_015200 [Hevea brasiliensis]|uniref:Malectin-like domain-containing protein n=1 Tax=Hevea brasiliensis TaxID=3981 RepID=A0A6A6K4S4_HEVBR|nr:hypothetical protein GH714_015200 [Hevea brasiliensis]
MLPSEETIAFAKIIEEESFLAAAAAAAAATSAGVEADPCRGIEILQVYSKEISKRMLEMVRNKACKRHGGAFSSEEISVLAIVGYDILQRHVSGRTFVGDINSNSSFTLGNSEAIYSSSPLPNTSSLYLTARVFRQKSQYELNVTKHGTYMVRLHFFVFESQGINLNNALFDVSTLNFSLLSKFRVQNSLPVIKEFFLTINVGKLRIQFSPSSFAFVNAIEVFLLPPNFIVDDAAAVPSVKNEKGSYHGLPSEALQTIYRINVGGLEIKESSDSLWRNWMQDDDYVISSTSAKTCAFYNGTLGEGPEPINDIAPDLVYRTCREVKDNSGEADLLNITWRFSVRNNTRHFVRFHFCNNIGALFEFNLYIDGEKTQEILPYNYTNFYNLTVDSDDSGFLKISIGPSKDYIDKKAYLNGLEIMELMMNKSLVPPEGQLHKSLFIIIGSVGGVASVSILIFLFLLGWRWRKAKPVKNLVLKPMLTCGIGSSRRV